MDEAARLGREGYDGGMVPPPREPIHAALPTALIGLAVGFGVGGAILLARRRDT